ncbi:MAG: hypothetical protein LUF68_01705 [Clostridiales bacterium]|nr:hypothetical protein [Clostridiales bacterium]
MKITIEMTDQEGMRLLEAVTGSQKVLQEMQRATGEKLYNQLAQKRKAAPAATDPAFDDDPAIRTERAK